MRVHHKIWDRAITTNICIIYSIFLWLLEVKPIFFYHYYNNKEVLTINSRENTLGKKYFQFWVQTRWKLSYLAVGSILIAIRLFYCFFFVSFVILYFYLPPLWFSFLFFDYLTIRNLLVVTVKVKISQVGFCTIQIT